MRTTSTRHEPRGARRSSAAPGPAPAVGSRPGGQWGNGGGGGYPDRGCWTATPGAGRHGDVGPAQPVPPAAPGPGRRRDRGTSPAPGSAARVRSRLHPRTASRPAAVGQVPFPPHVRPASSPPSWPGCAPRAASSPRTRPAAVSPTADDRGRARPLVARRVAGEPLEHLLGWAEFCGLRIAVEPGVFVPRRRTEFLVGRPSPSRRPRRRRRRPVLRIGRGGRGGGGRPGDRAARRRRRPGRRGLRPAQPPGGGRLRGDLFDALPRRCAAGRLLRGECPVRADVAIELMPPEARLHEPRVALDGGADGLDIARRVIAGAPRWLAPGGPAVRDQRGPGAGAAAAALRRASSR